MVCFLTHIPKKCILYYFTPQNHQINLASIQSRSSKRSEDTYEFLVEIDNNSTKGDFQTAMNDLKDKTKYLQVIGRDYKDSPDTIPWFPRNIKVSFHIILVQHIFFSFLTSKIESRTEYENK